MITDVKDINNNYEKFIKNLAQPRPKEENKIDEKTRMEDFFKNFRTRVALSWIFSNALVVIIMTNEELVKKIQQPFLQPGREELAGNPFLQFIFWSVAALSLVRFLGTSLYLILNIRA